MSSSSWLRKGTRNASRNTDMLCYRMETGARNEDNTADSPRAGFAFDGLSPSVSASIEQPFTERARGGALMLLSAGRVTATDSNASYGISGSSGGDSVSGAPELPLLRRKTMSRTAATATTAAMATPIMTVDIADAGVGTSISVSRLGAPTTLKTVEEGMIS